MQDDGDGPLRVSDFTEPGIATAGQAGSDGGYNKVIERAGRRVVEYRCSVVVIGARNDRGQAKTSRPMQTPLLDSRQTSPACLGRTRGMW